MHQYVATRARKSPSLVQERYRLFLSSMIGLIVVWALTLCTTAGAVQAEYVSALRDANYTVYSGDVNGDGYDDLLLRSRDQFGYVEDEYTIPVWLRWRSTFVLISGPDGIYTLTLNPPLSILSHYGWREGTHALSYQDADADGSEEMLVRPIVPFGASVLIGSSSRESLSEILCN